MPNDVFHLFFILFIHSVFIKEIRSKCHGHYNYRTGISGGQRTTVKQHPYQVNFLCESNTNDTIIDGFCGGSIISARYILTAAHCIYRGSIAHVRVGSTYSNERGTVYTTMRLFSHPNYNPNNYDYDVGLIDLGKNIKLDGKTAKAISLPTPGAVVQSGSKVVVTGWGLTKKDGEISKQLMEVTVPTISNAECSKSHDIPITRRMLCAGQLQGGKGVCEGDSGGPAVDTTSGVQLGVVSWGRGCASPGFPGVFTNLTDSEIRDWIKSRSGV